MRISKETNVEENIIHLENMSDDDRDIDIESEDEDSDTRSQNSKNPNLNFSQAEKRAHHNALERKRRDHIKDSFSSLRESVPHLNNEKVASRAQILKRAAEYIQHMRNKNYSHLQDIQDLKRQNTILENQIRSLERKKASLSDKNNSDNSRDSEISDVEQEFDIEMANGKKAKTLS